MERNVKTKAIRLSKKILKYLLLTGAICVAASSPYFVFHLTRNIWRFKNYKPYDKRKITDTFSYLKRRGLIEVKKDNHDFKIALTEEGKKRAKKYQIDDLKIKEPKRWDKRWRVVIFDIPDSERIKRDVFRRKLKELGFYSLQKSVWAHPFDCKREIEFLREFFGLNVKQIQLLIVDKIEKDASLKTVYKL